MNTQLKTISNYYLEEDLIYDFYNNQILLNQESIISHEQHSQQLYEQQYNYQNEIDYMDISFENYKSFSEFQNDEEEEGEVVDQNEQEEEEEYFIWSENDLFEVSINTNIDYFEGQQLDFNFTYRQRTIFTQPKKLCDLDAAKELSFQFQHFNKNISFDELKQQQIPHNNYLIISNNDEKKNQQIKEISHLSNQQARSEQLRNQLLEKNVSYNI